jgi:hypothetical protein
MFLILTKKALLYFLLKFLVLLQLSWRRGGKGLFSKDFISAFNILYIFAMSFFSVPNSQTEP